MPGKIEEAAVIDDEAFGILADDRGLHAVIEDLARSPANRFARGNVAAQHGLQVLVNDETSPDQTRMAKYQRE
jgi:hypothetical protein